MSDELLFLSTLKLIAMFASLNGQNNVRYNLVLDLPQYSHIVLKDSSSLRGPCFEFVHYLIFEIITQFEIFFDIIAHCFGTDQ